MTRYSRKDVEKATAELAKTLGVGLRIEAYSPGDRHGTRYRIHATGDFGPQLIAACGAGPTTKLIWTVTDVLTYYKHTQRHTASPATAQLENIETQ